MDYVNPLYIKDIGFHDLFSQAAVNKMPEHILNLGDLLICSACMFSFITGVYMVINGLCRVFYDVYVMAEGNL